MHSTIISHDLQMLLMHYYLNGVMGCELPNGIFTEVSNFHISSVQMKIKVQEMKAGWVVVVTDVFGGEEQYVLHVIMQLR